MAKNIVVQGCDFSISPTVLTSSIVINSIPSNNKANNKGIYKSPLSITISGVTMAGFSQSSPMTASISSTATKTKTDNSFVLLEGDESVTITLPGTVTQTTPTPSLPVIVTISSAGQSKVKGV